MKSISKYQMAGMTQAEQYQYQKALRLKNDAHRLKVAKARIALAAMLLIVLGSMILSGAKGSAKASESGTQSVKCFTNVEVNKGDTLWDIAKRYSTGTSDTAVMNTVKEIQQLNHIKQYEVIRSGDMLVVPYYIYEE